VLFGNASVVSSRNERAIGYRGAIRSDRGPRRIGWNQDDCGGMPLPAITSEKPSGKHDRMQSVAKPRGNKSCKALMLMPHR